MRVGLLTSSRADYGIYKPLLRELSSDSFFDLDLIVFGTHLSERYGYTVREIEADGFNIGYRAETAPVRDTPAAVAESMALTINSFARLWESSHFDIVIALGDRYEMFAAVSSLVPFNIPVAHIHGGETTLGAIDNAFRHSITHFSSLHFASCEQYKKRIIELTGSEDNVFNAGALSMDMMKDTVIMSAEEFREAFGFDLLSPFILMTFHPETVAGERNKEYVKELEEALRALKRYNILITMPNADPLGLFIREAFQRLSAELPNVNCVENLGTRGYFTCLKYCSMMLGNSSSGFTEALYYDKPVINTGERQLGRIVTPNIFNCQVKREDILNSVKLAEKYVAGSATNIYGDGHSAEFIAEKIKDFFQKQVL